MRSVKTVLKLLVIVLAAALLATSMAYADDRGRGGGRDNRGGGHYYGGGRDNRGGGHYYGGGRYYRGGHYYGGGRYYGWRPWGYYPRFYLNYYPNYYPYYDPYYYPYSPTVIAPSTPPAYIEREQEGIGQEAGQEPAPSGVWYYCPDSKAYYPYVKKCPGGWQTVPAEPPAEPRR